MENEEYCDEEECETISLDDGEDLVTTFNKNFSRDFGM